MRFTVVCEDCNRAVAAKPWKHGGFVADDGQGGTYVNGSPRSAVAGLASLHGWPVMEIVEEGQPTRAALRASADRASELLTRRLEGEGAELAWESVGWDRERPDALTITATDGNGNERRVVVPLDKVALIRAAERMAHAARKAAGR